MLHKKYFTKIVLGIDPKLYNQFHIQMKLHGEESHGDILFLKENYHDKIQNLILMSKLKNDANIYCIKNTDLVFIVYKGIILFLYDVYNSYYTQINNVNNLLGYNNISTLDTHDVWYLMTEKPIQI